MVVQKFNDYTDYIWRGQRCNQELKSSFDRKFPDHGNRLQKLQEVFDKLEEHLTDSKKDASKLTKDKKWAIGQHYGLPTPFLDWTECPYIASYFAFYKNSYKQNFRVVCALNKCVKRRLSVKKIKDTSKNVIKRQTERFVEFPDIDHGLGEEQNERLKAQKGKFTKALNGIEIKLNVKNYYQHELSRKVLDGNEVLLVILLISDSAKEKFLTNLKEKEITHGKLFPDYAGAIDICKKELGFE